MTIKNDEFNIVCIIPHPTPNPHDEKCVLMWIIVPVKCFDAYVGNGSTHISVYFLKIFEKLVIELLKIGFCHFPTNFLLKFERNCHFKAILSCFDHSLSIEVPENTH